MHSQTETDNSRIPVERGRLQIKPWQTYVQHASERRIGCPRSRRSPPQSTLDGRRATTGTKGTSRHTRDGDARKLSGTPYTGHSDVPARARTLYYYITPAARIRSRAGHGLASRPPRSGRARGTRRVQPLSGCLFPVGFSLLFSRQDELSATDGCGRARSRPPGSGGLPWPGPKSPANSCVWRWIGASCARGRWDVAVRVRRGAAVGWSGWTRHKRTPPSDGTGRGGPAMHAWPCCWSYGPGDLRPTIDPDLHAGGPGRLASSPAPARRPDLALASCAACPCGHVSRITFTCGRVWLLERTRALVPCF